MNQKSENVSAEAWVHWKGGSLNYLVAQRKEGKVGQGWRSLCRGQKTSLSFYSSKFSIVAPATKDKLTGEKTNESLLICRPQGLMGHAWGKTSTSQRGGSKFRLQRHLQLHGREKRCVWGVGGGWWGKYVNRERLVKQIWVVFSLLVSTFWHVDSLLFLNRKGDTLGSCPVPYKRLTSILFPELLLCLLTPKITSSK